jgi:hypothetical protein
MARVNAAIAQEQLAKGEDVNPWQFSTNMCWAVSAASDVEQAYEYAVNAGNPDPGGDPAVITDGMILSGVQANWPENPVIAPQKK